MLRRCSCALLALVLAAGALAGEPASPARRPRIGLVLGGGGARGAAHLGVLEVLEDLHVPVDCVAGTSMGALVAGGWAAGASPQSMRAEMAATDWSDIFLDAPDFTELPLRAKDLARRFLPGTESGVSLESGVTYPPGVVAGQKIKLFINRLVRADAGEREISQLRLPLSIVATDIGTGERVVFRNGSLTEAMRASMSVPGLMAPVDLAGHKLVDGGLVDNLPVREVRERCNADVVIAVNVGSPLYKPNEIVGLLSITGQVVNILTEQNVTRSKAELGERDIYIQPDLEGIGSSDFARNVEAAELGRAAALAVKDRLAALALADPKDYAAWLGRFEDHRPESPRIDRVEVDGLTRVAPETVKRHLRQQPGSPLDRASLEQDLLRVYADGWYESVDYQLIDRDGEHVLRVLPTEKSWGPNYLRLGVNLESNLSQGSTYSLRAAYDRTWINPFGGELLVTGEIGSHTGGGVEWFQPVDAAQDYFVFVDAEYRRERRDWFRDDRRVGLVRLGSSSLDLLFGHQFGPSGLIMGGWRLAHRSASVDTGIDELPSPSYDANGALLQLVWDSSNHLSLSSRGWNLRASWFGAANGDYSRLSADLRASGTLGDWVLGTRLSYTGSLHGTLPYYDAPALGGFLNLSGFSTGQLVADSATYAHVRGEHIIGRMPLGLRGDLRLGLALEAGRLGQPYFETERTGWLNSFATYLGGETPIGTVYLGLGYSTAGHGSTNAYLFVGTP